jgi:glycine/D-amino acid oxidase-like deaminating enzyme
MDVEITSTRAVTMERTKKILICGGGIAGPACAWWLTKYGFSVVVVEKASTFRDGGQAWRPDGDHRPDYLSGQ